MDRQFAEIMRRHVDAIDLHLGAMSEIARNETDATKEQMLRTIFRCVDELYQGVSRPIADVYPDLHPDKDRM